MVISASRRTDIPAFYAEWFVNRLLDGSFDIRNPMNIHRITEWHFSPATIDCIVFWTKNASPLIPLLEKLNDYNYYFQYTINPYDSSIEPFVPKKSIVIDTFKRLSDIIGPHRIVWRYDPIILTHKIDVGYHLTYFERLASLLEGYSERCVISFLDIYKRIESRLRINGIISPDDSQIRILASTMSKIAQDNHFSLMTCSECIDLSEYGIEHSCCIDKNIIENITGRKYSLKKDPYQRKECGCVQSVDIGEYNTCPHNCAYCYASYSEQLMKKKQALHNNNSKLIIGNPSKDDNIIIKHALSSIINSWPSLFK